MSYQEDGYIECDECGHALEAHFLKGCSHCTCTERWTRDEIRKARQEAGLPAKFFRPEF